MQYLCGSYSRLSLADLKNNNNDESSSIQSQKMIIESFSKFNNLKIVKEYTDDGYSGGNFDRPDFKRMIEDIESGIINCVITKDLSRLGREIYRTGNYIEQYFLEKGVRYIAINDSYDSNIGDSMLGIRLSVNDLYLRDVSKKVRTSFDAKRKNGDYIGSFPLYGYVKSKEDRHKLVIDENVREYVELIYELALEGMSPGSIASILTHKKIAIPIVYKKEKRGLNVVENDGFGIWKRQTVKSILTNKMYIGHMVQNTFNKLSYNNKKLIKVHEDNHIIVENTHEGIITKEKFDEVQKALKSKSTPKLINNQDKFLLSGLLKCKDCGRSIRISQRNLKKGVSNYTQCNLYTRKGKFGVCTSHKVNYDWLEEDIINLLKDICNKFCNYYDFDEIINNSKNIFSIDIDKIEEKILNLEKKLDKQKSLVEQFYLDKVNNIISEEMYLNISEKSNLEIKKLSIDLEKLETKKSILLNEYETGKFDKTIKNIQNFMSLKNPGREEIKRLVDKIEIDKDKNIYLSLKFKEILN